MIEPLMTRSLLASQWQSCDPRLQAAEDLIWELCWEFDRLQSAPADADPSRFVGGRAMLWMIASDLDRMGLAVIVRGGEIAVKPRFAYSGS